MKIDDFKLVDFIRQHQPLTIQQISSYLMLDELFTRCYLEDLEKEYPIMEKDSKFFLMEEFDEICGIPNSEFNVRKPTLILINRVFEYFKHSNTFVRFAEISKYFCNMAQPTISRETLLFLIDKLVEAGIVTRISGNNTTYILSKNISLNKNLSLTKKIGPKTLMVIGNGFDLHFHLRTSYYNFYSFISMVNNHDDYESFHKDYLKLINNAYDSPDFKMAYDKSKEYTNTNFFVKYFMDCFHNEITWVGVEKEIERILKCFDEFFSQTNAISSIATKSIRYIVMKENIEKSGLKKRFFDRILRLGNTDIFSIKDNYIDFFYDKAIDSNESPYELDEKFKEEFPDKLYKSLKDFELVFSYYLFYMLPLHVEKDENFFFDASSYLMNCNMQNIISYNYTRYALDQFSDVNIKYIHGKINDSKQNLSRSKIIFGIDVNSKNVFLNKGFDYFKKDFRRDEYQTEYSSISTILTDVQRIIIYGHSMDEIDYDSLRYIINTSYMNYILSQKNHLKNPIETEERKLWKNNFEICVFYHNEESNRKINASLRDILGKNFESIKHTGGLKYYPDCNNVE